MLIPRRPARARLPNGMEVACASRREALLVWSEVGSYVRRGLAIAPGDVIVDVGANIGLFSLWAYEACARDATVYAFEPIPAVHAMLDENLRALGVPRVRAFPFGLSDRAARVEFSYLPNATLGSTAFPDGDDLRTTRVLLDRSLDRLPPPLHLTEHLPGPLRRVAVAALSRVIQMRQTVSCELRTLSSVIRDQGITRIDFLKIDAEKSELDVLRGIDDEHWPMVRQAFVELHDRDGRCETVRALFERQGFARIVVEQEPFFEGTDIKAVYAAR